MLSGFKRIIWHAAPPKLLPMLTFLKLSTYGLSYMLPTQLIITPNDGGFFSNLNKVVQHLVLSLNHSGIRAIMVDWRLNSQRALSQFPYGRLNDGNIWEHFFEPLSFPADSFTRSTTIAYWRDHSITDRAAYALYKSGNQWRRRYHAAFTKYIRIRPHILEKVDRLYAEHMAGRYCIGIHIRNEAHKVEEPDNEATPLDKLAAKVQNILQSRSGKAVIFLATDVEDYARRFKDVIGPEVIVQPGVTRLLEHPTGDFNHQMHHGYALPSLKLGEEVLIDCLLLARCDIFVHTVSNVATAVGYINPTIPMVFCE